MIAVAAAGHRHCSGDPDGECFACFEDQLWSGATGRACRTPEPDPDEPLLCRWCSHTVEPALEPALAPARLLCPDCERDECGCST